MSFLIGVVLLLQLLLFLLDVREASWRSEEEADKEPIRWRALALLVGVSGVYLSVQLLGGWLVPRPLEIMDSARAWATSKTGAASTVPLSNVGAILFGVAVFYTAGLWDYLVHRFFSHHRWFFVTHEYHHLPRRIAVWMPGILTRPFGFIPVAISTFALGVSVYLSLAVAGMPLWDMRSAVPALLLIILILPASHSSFLRRRWWFHRVMKIGWLTTPQEHLLHHGVDSDCNYGNFTTLWDRLFGTYIDPVGVDLEEVPLGLPYDRDFLSTLTFGRLRLSPSFRQTYEVGRYCNLQEPGNTS